MGCTMEKANTGGLGKERGLLEGKGTFKPVNVQILQKQNHSSHSGHVGTGMEASWKEGGRERGSLEFLPASCLGFALIASLW